MKALLPWSGHYEVQPALWAIAHTTQFAQPGWNYLDTSCGLLAGAGSFVALKSPKGKDFSLIAETIDASAPQRLVCRLSGGLRAKALHIWRSTEESQFDRLADAPVISSCFTLLLEPHAIYSVTTTSEQRKGMARRIPSAAPFPFPYTDDFEQTRVGKLPRYFADQGGVFELAKRSDGKGHCLRQTITLRGIDWNPHPTPEPYTMLGSSQWRNYEASCDVLVENAGTAGISGRIVRSRQTADPPLGYRLNVSTDGSWELKAFTNTLASGKTAFAADVWHNLKLRFIDSTIAPVIDGVEQPSLTDSTYAAGMAGLASGWNAAQFDNFTARPLEASQLK
jgi:galactosylceramidase